jgi:hypothetical protein
MKGDLKEGGHGNAKMDASGSGTSDGLDEHGGKLSGSVK